VLAWLAWSQAGVAAWIGATAVALWVAKDLVLFPFTWRAYLPGSTAPEDGRVGAGARGRAREALAQQGYIEIGGELWRAQRAAGSPPVVAGDAVQVVRREGLTLIVERVETGDR
jgi:membrane protein implicated in regulation of membrane protease activity